MKSINQDIQFTSKIRNTAEDAAKAAGEIQLRHFGKKLKVDYMGKDDLKLEVDRLCEQVIIEIIVNNFPEHSILAEESGFAMKESEFIWIIDPLDGSVNFFHSIPYFCVCVACYFKSQGVSNEFQDPFGTPLVGVTYDAFKDELFTGINGRGAFCNGDKINPCTNKNLSEAVITLTFGNDETTNRRMERINSNLLRHG